MEEEKKVTEDFILEIANMAASILKPGIDYDDILKTKIEYAYLYKEPSGPFGLLKLVTDKGTFAFRADEKGVYRMAPEFLEEKYDEIAKQVINNHGGKRFN